MNIAIIIYTIKVVPNVDIADITNPILNNIVGIFVILSNLLHNPVIIIFYCLIQTYKVLF